MTEKKEKVYEVIKNSIIFCELEQGQVVNEKGLMERFGFGRTPVREAIIRLSAEGLLKVLPQRGVVVREIDILDVGRLMEMRELIEVNYAKKSLKVIGEKEIDKIKNLLRKNEELAKGRDLKKYAISDQNLHLQLYRYLDDPLLMRMLNIIYDQVTRILYYINVKRVGTYQTTHSGHRHIVAALESMNEEKVVTAIRDHLMKAKELIFSVIIGS